LCFCCVRGSGGGGDDGDDNDDDNDGDHTGSMLYMPPAPVAESLKIPTPVTTDDDAPSPSVTGGRPGKRDLTNPGTNPGSWDCWGI